MERERSADHNSGEGEKGTDLDRSTHFVRTGSFYSRVLGCVHICSHTRNRFAGNIISSLPAPRYIKNDSIMLPIRGVK